MLLRAALAFSTIGVAAAGGSVFAQNPFAWDTVQDKLYSFCSNASGALAPDALAALGKSKMMIHGMEEGAALPPVWQNSEAKIGLAATQLRAVNPSQLQLYTVQIVRPPRNENSRVELPAVEPILYSLTTLPCHRPWQDYARAVYTSGQWFYQHPECLNRDSNGVLMNHTGGNASLPTWQPGHCDFEKTATYPGSPLPAQSTGHSYTTSWGHLRPSNAASLYPPLHCA
jgi:hypothetical protein